MNPNLPLDHLITEARNPASTKLDELTPLELVQLMNGEDAKVIPAVAAQADTIARAIDVIAGQLRAGGRLIYAGAGTSGRLGVLDATECPPTFNSPPGQVVGIIAGGYEALTRAVEGAEDHPEYSERDLAALRFTAADVLVGIATSGRTPYVLGAVGYARKLGAFTIGLSCNPESDLGSAVELPLTITVGPEVLSGSTRLKAGTATKLVLNMLTTGAMVRLGKTYGNLMVDLRATNNKLKARTNRIVRILTGISVEEADTLLRSCEGELKTALVAQLAGVSVAAARSRLQQADGRVHAAIHAAATPVAAPSAREAAGQRLLIGIDGGGSKTVALLARAVNESSSAQGPWQLLGTGEAGSSNLHSAGPSAALAALDQAVARAFASAGMARQPADAACLGLAGAGRPEDQNVIHTWAKKVHLAGTVEVVSDVSLLIAAGTPDGWGLALVAGTGSCAWGQTADGRAARAGGWGYLLGDEGSGYALVIAALQAVARAADGRGPDTCLTQAFLHEFGVGQPQQLITALHRDQWDRTRLASLAPIVLEAAGSDPVAAAIRRSAACVLAETAVAAAHQLGWREQHVPMALAGGVLLGQVGYRALVLEQMQKHGIGAEPVQLVAQPALGALRCALRLSKSATLRACQA